MECIACKKEIPDGSIFCCWCGKKQTVTRKRRKKRSNGTGTVWRLSGKRTRPWVAQKDGQVIGYYETAKDADAALAGFIRTPVSERYNYTVEQCHTLWKEEHFRKVGPKGAESYNSAWNHLKTLKDKKLRDLRAEDWQGVITSMVEKGLSRSTCDKAKQLASQLSKWGIREEIITTNFASFIVLPNEDEKPVEIFSDDEVKTISECKDPAADVAMILIYTGMRINEFFSMRMENCFDDYMIGGSKTKKGKRRVIPVPMEIRDRYNAMRSRAAALSKEYLCGGYDGANEPANFRNRDYYPMLKRLGVRKIVPHTARKSFISANVKAGTRPEILQAIVGHADYNTTLQFYTKLSPETLVDAVENISLLPTNYQQNTSGEK